MKNLRWQILVVCLALVLIAILLISQRQTVSPTGEPVNAPTTGGVYSEALIGSFGRLNPIFDYYNPADFTIDRLIFSSLVRFDSRGLPHGDLATDWGISQDGTSYSFAIRRDAVWHDGQPVTAEDVVFTVELLKNPKNPLPLDLRAFWRQIEAHALDEKIVQFTLPEAFAPFLDYLTFGVLPKHLLEGVPMEELIDSPFNLQPVGSGPFRFHSLLIEDEQVVGVQLVAFDQYYGNQPYLEQIVFHYYSDAIAALFAYKQGEVLGVSQLTSDTLNEALREPNLNVFSARLPRLNMIFFNLGDATLPFFQDPSVRRALLLGLNRRWIVDRILLGQAIIAHGPIFPENWAYYEGVEQIEYDPETALNLLKEAGYTIPAEGGSVRAKDGVPISFTLVFPQNDLYAAIAEQVRLDWSKLGVEVMPLAVSYEALLKQYLEPRAFQAALVELDFSRYPDPDPYPFWHQAQKTSGQNYAQWDDRQVSEYLEQGRVLSDFHERLRRYRNFQVRFSADLPALPLFYPVYSFGVDRQVLGVSVGPLYDPADRFFTVTAWYLATAPVALSSVTGTP